MGTSRPAWAKRLEIERVSRDWTTFDMARELLKAAGTEYPPVRSLVRQILDWERGVHYPRDWATAYAGAFGIDQDVLFSKEQNPGEQGDEDVERRRLLQALAALGVDSSPVLDAVRSIRVSVDGVLGRDDSSDIDDWEQTVAEYGYTYLRRPPHALLPDVAADLVTVQQIMARRKQGHDRQFPSWSRVTAGLSLVMAKTLCNLGQPRHARDWWVTAQQAADLAGDPALGLWISGERIVHQIYDGYPSPVLLRTVDEAIDRGSETRSPTAGRGRAHLYTARAQLHALEGARRDAIADVHRGEEVFEQLPLAISQDVESFAGFAEDRMRYTELWVYAHVGDVAGMDRAASHALAVLPREKTRMHTQVNLLQAFGHVRSGDIPEGVRHARRAYQAHPDEQKTTMVIRLAGQVLEAVPGGSRHDSAVAGYRELLSSDSPRKAIK